MRRRATAYRATECDPPVPKKNDSSRVRSEETQASDGYGNVRGPVMANEGGGGPGSVEEVVERPTVTDLGETSEDSSVSDEEEASATADSDSDDDSDDEVGLESGAKSRGALPTGSNLSTDDCNSGVLPVSSGGVQPQQQVSNVATYGNITVKDSSGIHFGNKTVYHGPVIIEQHVYGSKVVKQLDDSLQLKFGGTQLAITDGSTNVVQLSSSGQKRTTSSGLELSSGSFRIGAASSSISKGGSSFLWRHLLGRRSGSATWVAWVALCLGCMAILAVVLTVTLLRTPERREPTPTQDTDEFETKEFTNSYKTPAKQQNRTILSRRRLSVVPRREWVAQPPTSTILLKHPVEYVIISHTATDPCTTQAECTLIVRYLQVFHVESRKWTDISYNFMVAGDGQAYEGRGWDAVGAHTTAGYNGISVGISFVGTFDKVIPPPVQIKACKLLIEEGVKLGKISPKYKLIADQQLSPTKSTGQKLYEDLQTWEHWTAEV